MLQRYGHRSKAVSLYGCEQSSGWRRWVIYKISDPSARTDGLQTFFDSPMKLKAYEIICRETLRLSTVGKKALLIHRIMKHLHVSAIPSTPDHPSAIVTVIREKHMPLPREMRSMLSPIFRFQNSFCGMSQWSILGAGVRQQAYTV
jgi:hypothetical protein